MSQENNTAPAEMSRTKAYATAAATVLAPIAVIAYAAALIVPALIIGGVYGTYKAVTDLDNTKAKVKSFFNTLKEAFSVVGSDFKLFGGVVDKKLSEGEGAVAPKSEATSESALAKKAPTSGKFNSGASPAKEASNDVATAAPAAKADTLKHK